VGLGGGAAGAALTYLLDPDRGTTRRARIRDAVRRGAHVTADAAATTVRDAANRAYGTAAVLGRSMRPESADDRGLQERVRALIGRMTTHPHGIEATVRDGCVTLSG